MDDYFKEENKLVKVPKKYVPYLNPKYKPQIMFIDKNNAVIRFTSPKNKSVDIKFKNAKLKKKVDVNVSNDGINYFNPFVVTYPQ